MSELLPILTRLLKINEITEEEFVMFIEVIIKAESQPSSVFDISKYYSSSMIYSVDF